jgi:hypothetical protein
MRYGKCPECHKENERQFRGLEQRLESSKLIRKRRIEQALVPGNNHFLINSCAWERIRVAIAVKKTQIRGFRMLIHFSEFFFSAS